jgi:hypothetical protein
MESDTLRHGDVGKANQRTGSYRIRLPGFIIEGEIGLGDIIKRATSSVGIKPCGGCHDRAVALNQRFVFYGKVHD